MCVRSRSLADTNHITLLRSKQRSAAHTARVLMHARNKAMQIYNFKEILERRSTLILVAQHLIEVHHSALRKTARSAPFKVRPELSDSDRVARHRTSASSRAAASENGASELLLYLVSQARRFRQSSDVHDELNCRVRCCFLSVCDTWSRRNSNLAGLLTNALLLAKIRGIP